MQIERIKGGWAALGEGWAVHALTRDEARRKYREAEARHAQIMLQPPFYEQPHQAGSPLSRAGGRQ